MKFTKFETIFRHKAQSQFLCYQSQHSSPEVQPGTAVEQKSSEIDESHSKKQNAGQFQESTCSKSKGGDCVANSLNHTSCVVSTTEVDNSLKNENDEKYGVKSRIDLVKPEVHIRKENTVTRLMPEDGAASKPDFTKPLVDKITTQKSNAKVKEVANPHEQLEEGHSRGNYDSRYGRNDGERDSDRMASSHCDNSLQTSDSRKFVDEMAQDNGTVENMKQNDGKSVDDDNTVQGMKRVSSFRVRN